MERGLRKTYVFHEHRRGMKSVPLSLLSPGAIGFNSDNRISRK